MTEAAAPGLGYDHLPGLYRAAERASKASQTSYLRWTRGRLILVVIAAVSGLADVTVKVGGTDLDLLALVAVACFLAALAAEAYLLLSKPDQMWYHGRAIAESVKSLTWRYVMRAEPFAEITDQAADALFRDRLREILAQSPVAGELETEEGQQVTPRMRELRGRPFAARKAIYLSGRVDDQVTWYANKARGARSKASFWRSAMLILEFAGVVFAVLLLIRLLHRSVDGVLAAMIAGAGAWLEVKQFESLATAYNLTARELSMAREDGEVIAAAERWPEYVATTEEAISREHTMWLVRRLGPRFGPA